MRNHFHWAVAALAAASASATAAPSTEPAIIVTATRLAEQQQLPANVSVITAADIARSPATNLPELLAAEAGIQSRSLYGNHGARATVDLRGFGATAKQNTLILVDGRRLNDIDNAAIDFTAVPLENIERIEIVRSGGAVLYGDGTAGGTINIVTKPALGTEPSGELAATAGSYHTAGAQAQLSGGSGPFSGRLHANVLRSDGYRDNNELRQRNLQGDLSWLGDAGERFLRFGVDSQELGLPGERIVDPGAGINELETDRDGTSNPDDWGEQRGAYISAGISRYLADGAELVLDGGFRRKEQEAFYDDYEGSPPFYPPGTFARFVDSRLDTWSLTPRLTMPHGTDGQHTFTVGVDLYYSQYDSERGQRPDTAPIHSLDVTQHRIAAYAHESTALDEHTTLSAGIRVQHVTLDSEDRYDPAAPGQPFGGNQAASLDRSDTEPMAELGLRRAFGEHWSGYAKLERSVRFGTIDEIFETNANTFALEFSPLAPQTSSHVDLGAEFRNGAQHYSAGVYYMRLNDEIHFDPVTFTNVNLDPTRRYGLELQGRQPLNRHWTVHGSYTYARAQFRDGVNDGKDVPLVPRHAASVGLEWQPRSDWLMSVIGRYVGEQRMENDEANTAAKIPDFTLVDVLLARETGDWRFEARINNLFDREAYDFAVASSFTAGRFAAYPLPERNFSLTVRRSF